jgi:hypothetical protein
MATKTPDFTRYPQYVQDYVSQLERDLAAARRRIQELSEGPETYNVQVDGTYVNPDRPLGQDVQIQFFMGKGRRRVDDTISIRHDRQNSDRTSLRVEGSGTLHIIPSASNSFRVVFGEY